MTNSLQRFAALPSRRQKVIVMKQSIIVRKKQAAELRRMAETTKEVERERKLRVLADKWDEEGLQLEEILYEPER
jgi:hypothetical protein